MLLASVETLLPCPCPLPTITGSIIWGCIGKLIKKWGNCLTKQASLDVVVVSISGVGIFFLYFGNGINYKIIYTFNLCIIYLSSRWSFESYLRCPTLHCVVAILHTCFGLLFLIRASGKLIFLNVVCPILFCYIYMC